jgi:hypothetical protein
MKIEDQASEMDWRGVDEKTWRVKWVKLQVTSRPMKPQVQQIEALKIKWVKLQKKINLEIKERQLNYLKMGVNLKIW